MNPITAKMSSVALSAVVMACMALGPVSCTDRTPCEPADGPVQQDARIEPALFQDFLPGWTDNKSPDGVWLINGIWVATGQNTFDPANVTFTETYPGEQGRGFMHFKSKANEKNGSEVQTIPCYGYGYYEVRMKVTGVGDPAENRGVCVSFFWKRRNYERAEWDFEFLTNGEWITSPDSGVVTMNYHLDNGQSKGHYQQLPFNPSKGFHRYGFLWQPHRLDWTVDGKILYSFESPDVASEPGYIMMNSWTGSRNWGGLPPAEDAISVYDWVKFYPDVTSIPNDGQE
ncbi:MAG: family 16 glycosylhydrolase [Planctomycetes bacterium]|nr:family 16 glycosylhydrolase [Planctomycetota bacterium]